MERTSFDVVVIGAGQAGIEAALASARLGQRTLCITMQLSRIGHLPCNCSIGGPAKGHIAREVDALGGQMGITTDYAMTHVRKVGTGKGPAVQTVRAQVCKTLYPQLMRHSLENQPNLELLEGTAEWIEVRGGSVDAVLVQVAGESQWTRVECKSVVVTTGTFLNGRCHIGLENQPAAREGDAPSVGLSKCLQELGVRMRRFKTGTTPRIRKSSIDFSHTSLMPSEAEAGPMSFLHSSLKVDASRLLPCWQTRTTIETHEVLKSNLMQSAMFSGNIEGVGPRYCPSVEDKVVRFADKDSHPIFLEQEEWESESIYVQGFSTSMPADVQLRALQSIPGLQAVEILRPGYAVEYDMADPLQLWPTLMSKQAKGLFLAGQLNGTSGYEEAAGQGIVAGINAARYAAEYDLLIFDRSESFIGVMIDDLVTKGVEDPYRMLTARAEHRLVLRHDNADQRLTPLSREIGLCDDARWARFSTKMQQVEQGIESLKASFVNPSHQGLLERYGIGPVQTKTSLFELLRRPNVSIETLVQIGGESSLWSPNSTCPEVQQQWQLAGKYEGYIQLQMRSVERHQKLSKLQIPESFAWHQLPGLSYESREKLSRVQPRTVGQAAHVPGVRPADIALLIGHLRARFRD